MAIIIKIIFGTMKVVSLFWAKPKDALTRTVL